jgi:hypothetical protein
MAKLTVSAVYTQIATNLGEVTTGTITIKQFRDRFRRLQNSASLAGLGLTLQAPSFAELSALRTLGARAVTPAPTAPDTWQKAVILANPVPDVNEDEYESSQEYVDSYSDSNCW